MHSRSDCIDEKVSMNLHDDLIHGICVHILNEHTQHCIRHHIGMRIDNSGKLWSVHWTDTHRTGAVTEPFI